MFKNNKFKSDCVFLEKKKGRASCSCMQAVARAADYMEAHYAEQITLSDPAHMAELSEGYLCGLFSQYDSISQSAPDSESESYAELFVSLGRVCCGSLRR